MQLPCALIVTDAAKAAVEAVLTACRGEPCGFARKLMPADTPSPIATTPPTHWISFDASLNEADVIAFQKFPAGELPPPADPEAAWGKDGLISAAEAAAAVSGANLQVYSVSGDVVPFDFCAAIIESRGLAFVPEPAF